MKKTIFTLMMLVAFSACKEKVSTSHVKTRTFVVKAVKQGEKLYFSGDIAPINEKVVSSPADAVVIDKFFRYGEEVKKGQLLARLNSSDLQKQYDEALTAFLKAKDALDVSKAKFAGTEKLWKAGLIARNSYEADKSTIHTNQITFLQAKNKLLEVISQTHKEDAKQLLQLRLEDIVKVRKALKKRYNLIELRAPSDGIALEPPKSDGDKTLIQVGSQLKQGDVITLIGDLSGLSIKMKVVEINIDKIKPGMKAYVNGVAFPGINLNAVVKSVNAQASSQAGASGGLPTFTTTVEVPHLSESMRKKIKVGMSASVKVDLNSDVRLLVPIAALSQKNSKTFVTRKNKRGELIQVEIKTGLTTKDKVEVLKGLKEGDVVIWKEGHN